MTKLMKELLAEASTLPAEEQDALASRMLYDLREEREWDERFARSQSLLNEMAEQARRDHREGRTVELNPDDL